MKHTENPRLVSHRAQREIECGSRFYAGNFFAAPGLLKGLRRSFMSRIGWGVLPGLFGLATLALLSGCLWGGGEPAKPQGATAPQPVEIIDLEKVLVSLSETLEELDLATIKTASDQQLAEMASVPQKGQERANKLRAKRLSPEERAQFIAKFSEKLNKIKPLKVTFGVLIDNEGAIRGFADQNGNREKDAQEKELFKVFFDSAHQRLIAADPEVKGPHFRDFSVGDFIPGSFSNSLLGVMWGDQMDKNVDTSRFGEFKISPKDYHAKASQPQAAPPAPPAAK